jgi:carbonic anhydrase
LVTTAVSETEVDARATAGSDAAEPAIPVESKGVWMNFETPHSSSRPAVSRRRVLTWMGVVIGAVAAGGLREPAALAFGQPAPAPTWNQDPDSPIGPSHWGDIGYTICGSGKNQSPINIVTQAVRPQAGPAIQIGYQESPLGIENLGHTIEIELPSGVTNSLQIGDDSWQLAQYHFHAPSEHSIDGRLADVEVHLVHSNAAGANAVVGVLYNVGGSPNPLLEKILNSAPTTPGDEVDAGEANPAELFAGLAGSQPVPVQLPSAAGPANPASIESFYFYDGSLTTPVCSEGVRWFVLTNIGQVSSAALSSFHNLISLFPDNEGYPNNTRPVQPLNGRIIGRRVAG